MKQVTEASKKNLELVFRECDIYHVEDYPIKHLTQELPGSLKKGRTKLRWNFLFGISGLLSTVGRYTSNIKKILGCLEEGDYPNGLRQRLNIVHILLQSKLDSLVPVHISISPPETDLTLDLFNDTIKGWSHITHPGYTRAVGSVFLNTPLKNVLLYIRKDKNLTIKDDPRIVRIETVEDLLNYYNGTDTSKNLELCFHMPRRHGKNPEYTNIVTHTHNNSLEDELPILKVNQIDRADKKQALGGSKDPVLHPSRFYYHNSIPGFIKFTEELYKNTYNIYTEHIPHLQRRFVDNFRHLLYENIGVKIIHDITHSNFLDEHNRTPGDYHMNFQKFSFNLDTEFDKMVKELTPVSREVLIKYNEYQDNHFNSAYQVRKIKKYDLEEIVKQNEYKGIALYVNQNILPEIDRDIFEFLFCINCNNTLTRTEDSSVVIINCGHTYWKTQSEYSEDILPKSFLKYE